MVEIKKPYPHLDSVSYSFFKEALTQGAQNKIPEKIASLPNGEGYWVRMRNIAGTQITSPASSAQISTMWEISPRTVRKIVRNFTEHLWKNCDEGTQAKFPLKSLRVINDNGRRRAEIETGGKQMKLVKLLMRTNGPLGDTSESMSVEEDFALLANIPQETLDFLRKVRDHGDDIELRKEVLSSAKRSFVEGNPSLFVSSSRVLKALGRVRRHNNSRGIIRYFDQRLIATVSLKNSKGRNMIYVYTPDLLRFKERTAQLDQNRVTDPS